MLITQDHFDELAKLGMLRQYKAGVLILREGETGDAIYLVRGGQVRSLSQALHGKEISYNIIPAGHYFGEMALDGGARSSSVEAVTDCECWVIPNEQVLAYAAQNSEFALHLLTTAISRARSATDAARDMALLDVYSRLTQALNREFEAHSGVCPLTHAQLASVIGSSREMVSKLIKDLVRGNYVEVKNRHTIKIKKLPIKW
jgi:CRP/FNR family transcriptional regulator, cyclic AMP receptor protein